MRILVALDGSPRSHAVLAAAVETARTRGGKLTLFRSVGVPADVPQDLWKAADEPLLDVMRGGARTPASGPSRRAPRRHALHGAG